MRDMSVHRRQLNSITSRWPGVTRRLSELSHPFNLVEAQASAARRQLPPLNVPVIAGALLLLSLLTWAVSLRQVDLGGMDDTGLVSVLPWEFFGALFMVTLSFGLVLFHRPLSVPLALANILALILMSFGATAVVQDVPRFAIGWRLAGIMDYIMHNGAVDGRIDAFFNWPGFFILMAFITQATGFDSVLQFMAWAHVIFNVLNLGPLWMIFQSTTADRRLTLAALWFFYLANWIGQDYLSPQAFNFYLFLVVLAVILTWLRGEAWPAQQVLDWARSRIRRLDRGVRWATGYLSGVERPIEPLAPWQRAGLVTFIIITLIAMVPSHQLTPFALLAAISALVVVNRMSTLTLPILLFVLIATWVFFGATAYISGHIGHVAGPVGSVGTNVDANLTARLRGSPDHIFIGYLRTAMSLAVWSLALIGGVRRILTGHRDIGVALLAVTPFPLLLLQAYGGELLLRIYLYSLPFMAFFVAGVFFPTPQRGRGVVAGVLLVAVSFGLAVSLLYARYGNERMDYFTTDEVAAVEHLYTVAEPGSQFVALTGTLPWRYREYQTYEYRTVPRIARLTDIPGLVGIMSDRRFPESYLILTRSQKASAELFIGWPEGTWEGFVSALDGSERFALVFANADARVYVLSNPCGKHSTGEQDCSYRRR
jgi:hypothetical protein